jgi:hypothetical protein
MVQILLRPCVIPNKDVLSSAPLMSGSHALLQEKRVGKAESGLPVSTIFSNAKVTYFGVLHPEPHQWEDR